jgi:hypothetical protein
MRSRGLEALLLNEQELRIRHFHRVLDEYVRRPPDRATAAPS